MIVLAFCGPPASGKSYVSKKIAQDFGFKNLKFGTYVRNEAVRRGLSTNRGSLQELGQTLIDTDVDEFCINCMDEFSIGKNESFVIDGLRHIEVLESLNRICGKNLIKVVYIDLDRTTLRNRLQQRDEVEMLDKFLSEPTEVQVTTALKGLADVELDGSNDLEVNVLKIRNVFSSYFALEG